MTALARIGIVTVSDRASRGQYQDLGGPAIRTELQKLLTTPWEAVARLIPDEQATIEETLTELADREKCCLIVTTGGTGPALRDVTPEATERMCQKMLPGFGELMRQVSLKVVPTAILSRQTAGIRGKCLIINLPGKPTAVAECLEILAAAIREAVEHLDAKHVDFEYDGEISPDVALNDELRKLYPFCRLSGPANVLVMPALDPANIASKLLHELGGGTTIGPLIIGLSRPVQILPMGSTVTEIVNMAALAAYDAIH